ncbi:STAS/SEC14 domain-containing protein [Candidatus Curtissbacteria bacterium]|nr:STAS/SEC14 domain-containing protein [Candidatus Curtissbacteria bacterium]
MQHRVFINSDNFIEAQIIGDIGLSEIAKLGQQVVNNITLLEENGRKINILIDYSKGTKTEEFGIALSKSIAKNLKFNKIAGFAANEETTKVIEEVNKAAGSENKIRLFKTRSEAEAWLKE